jgi:hypothetical protein
MGKPPLLAALGLALGLAACDQGLGPRNGARVNVYLTDAPGDVENAWLKIDGIHIIADDLQEIELLGDYDELILVSDLVGHAQQIVDDADVDLETFRQLRFIIGGAVLETKDGNVYAIPGTELPDELSDEDVGELHCPSCAQSGLKIVLQGEAPEIEEGDDVSIVIDFDVAQSFGRQAGNSGRWVMRPVVHATLSTEPNAPLAGGSSIGGTVALAQGASVAPCPAGTPRTLADFVPTATAATLKDANNMAVVRSGTTTAGGVFTISNVAPDTYALGALDVPVGNQQAGNWKLVFAASAAPASTPVVLGQNVQGVVYTVTGTSCLPM